ncbi:MAG: class I SAM-dependent methyltransferase [Bacteroidales bacterium]|jgi:SAM-dependent methyltransferase|nr:class I SAM-dependent methyltransferase [Bacteroidales bacterium]
MSKEWMNPDNFRKNDKANILLYYRHLKAYEYVKEFAVNKKVLEIGCGSGYGSKYLSEIANSITTVDLDIDSLEYAKKNNTNENIEYVHANILDRLKIKESTFDIVISFQVIEHINPLDSNIYLDEIKRLLKPNGYAILTTPNRLFRLHPFQKPTNKYHKIEYSPSQFEKVLKKHFSKVQLSVIRGNNFIEKTEKRRIKTPLSHFLMLIPIKKTLLFISRKFKLIFISDFFDKRGEKLVPNYIQNLHSDFEYNLNDFYLTNKHLKRGIDLIATCKI